MKLIFIRHGDPDYINDSLTEKGMREAEFLSERALNWKDEITHIYVSPLGRARKTATVVAGLSVLALACPVALCHGARQPVCQFPEA